MSESRFELWKVKEDTLTHFFLEELLETGERAKLNRSASSSEYEGAK